MASTCRPPGGSVVRPPVAGSAREHHRERRSAQPAARPACTPPQGHSEPRSHPERGAGRAPWRRVDPVAPGRKRRGATRGGTLGADGGARGRRGPPGRPARLLADPADPEPRRGGAGGGAGAGGGPEAVGPDRSVAPGALPPGRHLAGTRRSPVRTPRHQGTVLGAVCQRTQDLPSLPFPHLPRGGAGRGGQEPLLGPGGHGPAGAARGVGGRSWRGSPGPRHGAQRRGSLVRPCPHGETFL